MRGINETQQSGNVSGPIQYGETRNGDLAGSFILAVDRNNAYATFVRINVYGALVNVCRQRLHKGAYVIVTGELMNRQRSGGDETSSTTLTEIRARDVIFVRDHDRRMAGDYDGNNQGETDGKQEDCRQEG